MNKKLYWQLPFLALLIIGTVAIIVQQRNMPYQHNSGKIFGTFYNITYQSDHDLHQDILRELQEVDQSLSMFNSSSLISRINQGQRPDISGTLFEEVFQLAQQISDNTQGAFDITVAPLVNAWGFGFKKGELPDDRKVDSLRRLVDYRLLSIEKKGSKHFLVKKIPGMMLDCSAIAKGYGCDRVASLLKRHDVRNFMVEIGGEVVTNGINKERQPWKIGVAKPTEDSLPGRQELQAVLSISNQALATSGNYRNFYYRDGRKYAHTIDPLTGRPVQHSILSATVIAPTCATADAYATAFMVMGIERAKDLLARHPELTAYLIYTDNQGKYAVWTSPHASKYLR